jgi:pimeloyl-ACP methyl ester carboxylesterase
MHRARQRVATVPSATLATRFGAVRYVDHGDGPPVLFSHGVLGGHDNIRDCVDAYVGPGYRAVGPDRFGYLGSAMPAHATPNDQADAYAALLDHLRLTRVIAVGFSAGGPSAIAFALRHPGRLHGLVLASSYLPGMARPMPRTLVPALGAVVGWERGWWLLKEHRPELLARIMGVPRGWASRDDDFFLRIRDALFPIREKRRGVAFDALVSEPLSNAFPLEDITVPTLLVHAADDRLAPYDRVPAAAARIPGAQLVTIDAGGHLFLQHQAQVRAATQRFIGEQLRPIPPARRPA